MIKELHLAGILLLLLMSISCKEQSRAQQIVDLAMEAHGSSHLQNARVSFDFRDRHYTYTRKDNTYTYTRSFTDSTGDVQDILTNDGFYRRVNGDTVMLSEKLKNAYSNSVNSVIYFALLPYGLNDPAVNKKYLGQTQLKEKNYHLIKVSFNEEGGGEDFEDEFLYWVNTETHLMEYLAYSYLTEGGGFRFREAINPRLVAGVRFQDYINYKPQHKTDSLETLEEAFRRGEMEVLSKIELQNINVEQLQQ